MHYSTANFKHSLICRVVSTVLVCVFSFGVIIPPYVAQAQVLPMLPLPGAMVTPTPGYMPTLIKGITIHPENPLEFDFILDTGDSDLSGEALEKETVRLIKYFLASLTVPEEEMWVNLSPVEKDRVIPDSFGVTAMGMDLLAQDYILKQLTASLMYPEKELGQKFWDRVYKKAAQEYGTTDIPMDSFHKVWIVPDEALVFEKDNSAFVIKSHLKVMMEEDYLAARAAADGSSLMADDHNRRARPLGAPDDGGPGTSRPTELQTEVMREVILPEIEKEVNEGKNFANLRQIYQGMILATWFKKNLKESLLGQVYVDKNKLRGVEAKDQTAKEKIYDQYLKAFEKGVYNYIREDVDPVTQEVIPRQYFSGGFWGTQMGRVQSAVRYGTAAARKLAGLTRTALKRRGRGYSARAALVEETGSGKNEKVVVEINNKFAKVWDGDVQKQEEQLAARKKQEEADRVSDVVRRFRSGKSEGVQGKAVPGVSKKTGVQHVKVTRRTPSESAPADRAMLNFPTKRQSGWKRTWASSPVNPANLHPSVIPGARFSWFSRGERTGRLVDYGFGGNSSRFVGPYTRELMARKKGKEGSEAQQEETDRAMLSEKEVKDEIGRQMEEMPLTLYRMNYQEEIDDLAKRALEITREGKDFRVVITEGEETRQGRFLGRADAPYSRFSTGDGEVARYAKEIAKKAEFKVVPVEESDAGAQTVKDSKKLWQQYILPYFTKLAKTGMRVGFMTSLLQGKRIGLKLTVENATGSEFASSSVTGAAVDRAREFVDEYLEPFLKEKFPQAEVFISGTFRDERLNQGFTVELKFPESKTAAGKGETDRAMIAQRVQKRHHELHLPWLQRLVHQEVTQGHDIGLQILAQRWLEEKEGQGRKGILEAIEDGIGETVDQINVDKHLEELAKQGELKAPEIVTVEEFQQKQAEQYVAYRRKAVQAFLNGDYVPQFIFAGKATRLNRGAMYSLDIWDIAVDEGTVGQQERSDFHLGMGPRQLITYRMKLIELAKENAVNPDTVLKRQKIVINLNDEVEGIAIRDLLKHDFYGFNPANIYFINQPQFPGYRLKENGDLQLVRDSLELVYGHGDNAVQFVAKGEAYQVDASGEKRFIGEEQDVLDLLGDRYIASHRINDLTKFLVEEVVDTDKLALGIYLQEQGYDIVADLVDNPGKQKGGTASNHGLIETLAAKGSSVLSEFVEKQGEAGAPYNAFRLLYKADKLKSMLSNHSLKYYLRFKSGHFYLEAVTGDLTQFPDVNTAFIQKEGDLIHDFKALKNVPEALKFLRKQDAEFKRGAVSPDTYRTEQDPAMLAKKKLAGAFQTEVTQQIETDGVTMYQLRINPPTGLKKQGVKPAFATVVFDGKAKEALKEIDKRLKEEFKAVNMQGLRNFAVGKAAVSAVAGAGSLDDAWQTAVHTLQNELLDRVSMESGKGDAMLEATQDDTTYAASKGLWEEIMERSDYQGALEHVVSPEGKYDAQELTQVILLMIQDHLLLDMRGVDFFEAVKNAPKMNFDQFDQVMNDAGRMLNDSARKNLLTSRVFRKIQERNARMAAEESDATAQSEGDSAMLGIEPVGGIDLNPELLDLKIKRDGNGIPLPMIEQPMELLNEIEGFLPVIINVTPIQNLPMLLGLDTMPDDDSGATQLSQLGLSPVDIKGIRITENG